MPPAAERIESVWLDATQFDFPAEPLVVHFFNPFYGPVLQAVLRNVRSSVEVAPRDVLLCFTGGVPEEVSGDEAFAPVAAAPDQAVYRVVLPSA